jgi:hypothetical protein
VRIGAHQHVGVDVDTPRPQVEHVATARQVPAAAETRAVVEYFFRRIEFDLRYAFSSRPLEAVLSPVFDKVANTFVDSFVKRAEQIYGQR